MRILAHAEKGMPRSSLNERAASRRPSRPNARRSSRGHRSPIRRLNDCAWMSTHRSPSATRANTSGLSIHSDGVVRAVVSSATSLRRHAPELLTLDGDRFVRLAAFENEVGSEPTRRLAMQHVQMGRNCVARRARVGAVLTPITQRHTHYDAEFIRSAARPRAAVSVLLHLSKDLLQPIRMIQNFL